MREEIWTEKIFKDDAGYFLKITNNLTAQDIPAQDIPAQTSLAGVQQKESSP